MARYDKDTIRDFVRQWKREVAFEDRDRHRKEEKRLEQNKNTWFVGLVLTAFALAVLLILLFIGYFRA